MVLAGMLMVLIKELLIIQINMMAAYLIPSFIIKILVQWLVMVVIGDIVI